MPREADVFKSSITKTGVFFTGDPTKAWRHNVEDFMAAVAAEGEKDVRGQLQAGESRRAVVRGVTPNRVAGHVVGRAQSLSGKHWKATAVVSVSVRGVSGKQAVALMAGASRLESSGHAFRKTAGRLRRAKAANIAGLLRGVA